MIRPEDYIISDVGLCMRVVDTRRAKVIRVISGTSQKEPRSNYSKIILRYHRTQTMAPRHCLDDSLWSCMSTPKTQIFWAGVANLSTCKTLYLPSLKKQRLFIGTQNTHSLSLSHTRYVHICSGGEWVKVGKMKRRESHHHYRPQNYK